MNETKKTVETQAEAVETQAEAVEMVKCECCGEEFPVDACIEVAGGGHVCPDCLEELYIKCDDCGDYISEDDATTTADGRHICERCYESDYYVCEDCGAVIRRTVAKTVHRRGHEQYVCETCRGDNYRQCSDCGEWCYEDETRTTADGKTICDYCYDLCYFTCDCCNQVLHIDAYGEDGYCESCYNHEHNGVYDYHGYHDGYNPQYADGDDRQNEPTLGVELECDNGEFIYDCFSDLERYIHFERDGSLNDGVECISQPMSLRRHKQFEWEKVLDELKDQGFRSHDTDTCGLHVHIGRKNLPFLTIVKMDVWLNRWMLWRDVARRDSIYSGHYDDGKRVDISHAASNHHKTGKCKPKYGYRNERYQPLNTRNEETVEIRIFRGTLNRETLIGTLEMIHAMIKFADCVSIVGVYDSDNVEKFLQYIADHKDLYANVFPMLKRLAKAEREPAAAMEIINKQNQKKGE